MNRSFFAIGILFLFVGCTTNQLHFAKPSAANDIARLKSANIDAEVIDVTGIDVCKNCGEFSKMVWHAANYQGGLYEGFSPIPVNDWSEFVKSAIKPTGESAKKVVIQIDKVFLKTWQTPPYYACRVEITVIVGDKKRSGSGVVKVERGGQIVRSPTQVALNQEALESVRLAFISAYIDANEKF